nr:hypothetical protein [Belnapia arida]
MVRFVLSLTPRSASVYAVHERNPVLPVHKPAKLVMEELAHDIVREVARRYRDQKFQTAVTDQLDGQKHATSLSLYSSGWTGARATAMGGKRTFVLSGPKGWRPSSLPTFSCYRPVYFLPSASLHPVRSRSPRHDLGSKPPCQLLDPAVTAGSIPDDGPQVQCLEPVPNQRAGSVQRHSEAPPLTWCQLNPEYRDVIVDLAKPAASKKAAGSDLTDRELHIHSRSIPLPLQKQVKQLGWPLRLLVEVIQLQVTWISLVSDESCPIRFGEVA